MRAVIMQYKKIRDFNFINALYIIHYFLTEEL